MEQRPAGGAPSLKRGLSADGRSAADGGSPPKREKQQAAGVRSRVTDSPELAMARSVSVGLAAATGTSPQRSNSKPPSTTAGRGVASDKASLKQHATLRKHILVAEPSLASQEALLEQVAALMKDTWSWDELRKFFLRKAEMKENVEATVDLIRDDMDEDEDEDGAISESAEEGELLEEADEPEQAHQAAALPKVAPIAPPNADIVDASVDVVLAPALNLLQRASAAPAEVVGATTAAEGPSYDVSSGVDQQEAQLPPPPSAKKKSTKNLPAEEKQRLARERLLAQGKMWIEPVKKKAMSAFRTETDAQIQRGEFKEYEAQDESGRTFSSIRHVRTLRNRERCALVGVVLSCEFTTTRADPKAIIRVQDPTGTIALHAFAKQRDLLPGPPPGSILFIRNIYVDLWSGSHSVVAAANDGYDWVYTDLKVSTTTCPPRLVAQYGSVDLLSASQHAYALKLTSWAQFTLGIQSVVLGAESVVVDAPPALITKRRRRMAVEELNETTEFFDLVAQIVKVGPIGNETRDIFVTDFSSNPRLFKFDVRAPPVAEAQKPREPFGRYCLKVSLFNDLARAENSSLSVGKIVKLRNAKVRNRDFLEGSLWGDRNSGCRIERLGQADDGVPELVERRAAFAQALCADAGHDAPPQAAESTAPRSRLPPTTAPWEAPEHPIRSVNEIEQGKYFSCFGQVVSVSHAFPAGQGSELQTYRSIKITDFTANSRIQNEPDGDPGSPADPPKKAFGQYTLRILLSGRHADDDSADSFKTGDYLYFKCLRANDRGGRGLEAYILSEWQAEYPIFQTSGPCSALGPLLKRKSDFYARIGSPAPEAAVPITCASPILPTVDDDNDDDLGSQDRMDLDSILAEPKEQQQQSSVPPDRFGLLQDAKVNTIVDGVFQLVKVQAYTTGSISLAVTDWTEHPLITERYPPLPDPDVVHVEEPFGRYVLEVQVVNPKLQADRDFIDALAPGAVVRLRGLRVVRAPSVGLRGHLLETDHSNWERMREDSQDEQVLNLQSRRAATYQLSATQHDALVAEEIVEQTNPRLDENFEVAIAAAAAEPASETDSDRDMAANVSSSDDKHSPTCSVYYVGDQTTPTAIEDIDGCPARYTVRARVVDYLPKTLEDVIVGICRVCNVILPTEDRACRSCMSQHDASLGRDLEWAYRIMLQLDDGSDSLWAALFQDDFTSLFPMLPPASAYCDAATQVVDTLRSHLSILHPSIGENGAKKPMSAGPLLEMAIESYTVHGLRNVGPEGASAFKVFRTALRDPEGRLDESF